jgi:dihydrodipicolinate synthase/N-acetylneuraminate lyase
MTATLSAAAHVKLARGCVIPAHPLALTAARQLDERRQRALTRYYLAAGAGGLAVGVHTTQFAIHDPRCGLLEPVLALAAETMDEQVGSAAPIRIAGVVGELAQAVKEAELAAGLRYDAVLLSPTGGGTDENALLERARAVGEVLPVIGFYLQEAVGGSILSPTFWRRLVDLPCVVAIKIAPFNRYRTMDVLRGVALSDREDQIALYTGNDDAIVSDLLSSFTTTRLGGSTTLRIVGGLLGQWAVWTQAAVRLHEETRRAVAGEDRLLRALLEKAPQLTDANGAIFDVAHGFAGCIAGVNSVLADQGLLAGAWCIDAHETLSAGQHEEIERVRAAYPWLLDDEFIAANLDAWLK